MIDTVTCPICLHRIDWTRSRVRWEWSEYEERYVPVPPTEVAVDERENRRRLSYVQCPNEDDVGTHYLPALYGDFDEPLVLGLVGRSGTGKTCLLAAMLYEILRGALHVLDVDVSPLDLLAHQRFRRDCLEPFLSGRTLPPTEPGRCGYASCLLVTSPTGQRPLVLFDVPGGDFDDNRPAGVSTRFLAGVDALIFVDAVEYRPGGRGASPPPDVNAAFTLTVNGVQAAPDFRDIAATVALTKSDRVRFSHPADRWVRGRGTPTALDLATFADETEDVYAFLRSRGVESAVTPFEVFNRCTMHFVSAAGHDGFDLGPEPADRPEVRPSGVLRPLVAVLAMTGVLKPEEAHRVGR